MSELRKEFEKIAYKNKWNINKDPHGFYVDDFVNGAWWAFEEQQAKINAVIAVIETTNSNTSTALSDIEFLKNKIKEILK